MLTVKALGTTTTCTPSKDPGVSLELDTTGQPGGTTGGDTTGGGTSGGSGSGGGTSGGSGTSGSGGSATSGGLADTGANDHGGLKALALIAGTTVLLGGAIFTLTPWRKLRGTTR
ncbi:Gram-positive cocci surface proteins LPxTG domain-containing protein OS=Streptomyces antimycoticus OX=68175 GN=SSPO_059640 PE=4 SV=1 [Streptomyces antimycoticus]